MLLAALSAIFLSLGVIAFALAGRGEAARLAVPFSAGLVALQSLVWFALNSVTGNGVSDSVFYHMHTGLVGGDVSQYYGLIGGSFVGFLLLVYCCWRLFGALPNGRTPRAWGDIAVFGLLSAAVLANPFTVDVSQYAARQYLTVQRTDGFVDPVILSRPDKRKNLVVLYMESLERSYFDKIQFPRLVEELRKIEAKGRTFTGLGQPFGAGFTVGGMVAGQCGVPLIISGGENSLQVSRFMTGATCLGDLLKAEGYRTEYMGGSSNEFAGKGSFYQSHGFDAVIGLEQLKPQLADPDYLGPWGLQDDTLFDLARSRIDALATGPDPFAMVMLTLDTHHPDGHANTNRSCKDVVHGDGSNPMLTSVKCADQLAAAFVQGLLDSPMAENTVIVLASDHLAMVNGAAGDLAKIERNNFFVILEPGAQPATIPRKGSTLDIGPTIMAALGYDVPQIGFGVNLMGSIMTLAEKFPEGSARLELFADYLMGFQTVYAQLWDYPKIGDGFFVNVEGATAHFGQAAFKIPALMQLDTEGGIADVVQGDLLANTSLAGAALGADPATPILWLDSCSTLAALVPDTALPEGLCLGSGPLIAAEFKVQPLPKSMYLPLHEVITESVGATDDPSRLQRRQEALLALLVADGSLPLEVGLPATGYRGRDLLFRSAAADRGDSWSRLLTTDSLGTGVDVLLRRGINLIGVTADGRADVMTTLDLCAADVVSKTGIKSVIEAKPDYAFYAMVVHDTAFCDTGRAALNSAIGGLNLPVLGGIDYRQPYVAILGHDGIAQERTGPAGGRVLIRVGVGTKNAPIAALAETAGPLSQMPPAAQPAAGDSSPQIKNDAENGCALPPDVAMVPQPTAELTANQVTTLTAAVPASTIGFGAGWWNPEDAGRWIGAASAEFSIFVPASGGLLEMRGVPYRQAELPVEIRAGDQLLLQAVLAEGRVLQVNLAQLEGGVAHTLSLSFPNAVFRCPTSEGPSSTDRRALLAMIHDFRLVPATAKPATAEIYPVSQALAMPQPATGAASTTCLQVPESDRTLPTQALQLGTKVVIGTAEASALVGFGNGWWANEPAGRWIGAASAEVKVILPEGKDPIELEISGQPFQASLIHVELRYRDRRLFEGDFGADKPIIIPASDLPRGKVLYIHLRFADGTESCPKALGLSGDDRTLVAMIGAVTLRRAASDPMQAAFDPLPSIAHAGGEFAQNRVTNSLDALNVNSPFYDLFEIDLSWTTDRKLVCLHDWEDSFTSRFGEEIEGPLTEAEFARRLVDFYPERPENCTLASLAQWLRSNPGKRVVTDLKDDNVAGLELIASSYPDLLDRFLPQAFQPEEIATIKAIGFSDVIWTLYRFGGDDEAVLSALSQAPVFALTMTKDRAATGFANDVRAATGVRSYVHTVNDRAVAECYAGKGISGVYTDTLRGPMPPGTGQGEEGCLLTSE
jgi:phosphoglycerol transferase